MKYLPVLVAASLATVASYGQTTVFSDNFDRASLNGATYTYTTTAGGDGGASIASNILVLTNDASVTANASGRTYVTVPLASFSAPFASTLSANAGVVTWSFNMRQVRTDPSGFDSANYGAAVVLAGSSSDFTIGNGYAVALGNGTATDPLRLVRYTGGVDANSNLTNIITGTSPVADIGAEYLSVSVSYNPTTNTWTMSARSDGAASFTAPTSGTLTSVGSVVDNTYTGSAMTSMGVLWNYSTGATQTASFDNITVTTSASAVPEPSTYAALAGALALAGVIIHRRRRAV